MWGEDKVLKVYLFYNNDGRLCGFTNQKKIAKLYKRQRNNKQQKTDMSETEYRANLIESPSNRMELFEDVVQHNNSDMKFIMSRHESNEFNYNLDILYSSVIPNIEYIINNNEFVSKKVTKSLTKLIEYMNNNAKGLSTLSLFISLFPENFSNW